MIGFICFCFLPMSAQFDEKYFYIHAFFPSLFYCFSVFVISKLNAGERKTKQGWWIFNTKSIDAFRNKFQGIFS